MNCPHPKGYGVHTSHRIAQKSFGTSPCPSGIPLREFGEGKILAQAKSEGEVLSEMCVHRSPKREGLDFDSLLPLGEGLGMRVIH
jgi:hypothetical protein